MRPEPDVRDRLQFSERPYEAPWRDAHRGHASIIDERNVKLQALLIRHGFWPLGTLEVLDIGCGGGGNLGGLLAWGADAERLHGIDVLPEKIANAKALWPAIDFRVADGRDFSLGPASVDLVLLFTVLSSVRDDATIVGIADRVREMLRPGGAVVVYDFFIKNPRNRGARPIRQRDIVAFFPDFKADVEKITVFPPLVRALGRLSPTAYPYLSRIPFLRGHYMGILRRRQSPGDER